MTPELWLTTKSAANILGCSANNLCQYSHRCRRIVKRVPISSDPRAVPKYLIWHGDTILQAAGFYIPGKISPARAIELAIRANDIATGRWSLPRPEGA